MSFPIDSTEGPFNVTVSVPRLPLVEGDFTVGVYFVSDKFIGDLSDLGEFTVTGPETSSSNSLYPPEVRGLVVLEAEVTLESQASKAVLSETPR